MGVSPMHVELRRQYFVLDQAPFLLKQDLMEALTRLGYRISGVASEGNQAVTMATQLRPELVVMDVSLRGEIDGIQAARLMQEHAHVPVIFLTGHRDAETLQRALRTHQQAVGEKIVGQAVTRGELPPDTNTDLAVDLMLGPLYWRLAVSRTPIDDDYLEHLSTAVLGALRASGSTS